MEEESNRLLTGELPVVRPDDTGGPPRPPRFRPVRITLKLALAVVDVNPVLLAAGFLLELAALYTYSLLTRPRSANRRPRSPPGGCSGSS